MGVEWTVYALSKGRETAYLTLADTVAENPSTTVKLHRDLDANENRAICHADNRKNGASVASVPRVQLPVQDSPAAVPTMQNTISDESGTFDQSGSSFVLQDAMKACREGRPGSYANFCKVLSAARAAGQLCL